MNPDVPHVLVPPRPNLGPEPWQSTQPLSAPRLAALLVLVLVLLALGWFFRRRRSRAARTGRNALSPSGLTERDSTPRDRLVALSATIRDALTVAFGTTCRAKTTEELAADGRLEQLLGDQDLHDLIRFLDQIDRLKFAPERSDDHHEALQAALTTWQPRVESLQARIRTAVVRSPSSVGGKESRPS